ADAALQIAAQLAAGRGLPLVLHGAGRRGRFDVLAGLLRARGVDVREPGDGDADALLVAPAGVAGVDWPVRPRPDDAVADPLEWTASITGRHSAEAIGAVGATGSSEATARS
ncbi:MAG: hypothetical protein INR67_16510, partial [Jatrophihabitans endophyticus]